MASIKHTLRRIKKKIESLIENNRHRPFEPHFIDEHRTVITGQEAVSRLESKSDQGYFQAGQGVTEVDGLRWEEAQRYERRTWMEGSGLKTCDDRNVFHTRQFDNYAAIRGLRFENPIEIGCGPFTNMIHVLEHIDCGTVTLLDPLIGDYRAHPNCSYQDGNLLGKAIETIPLPIEEFYPERQFDLVIVINVLEHCLSAAKFFSRILEITAPDGTLVFHDKLLTTELVHKYVENIYDAGHPLRVADHVILGFIEKHFEERHRKYQNINTPLGTVRSVYYIGNRLGKR